MVDPEDTELSSGGDLAPKAHLAAPLIDSHDCSGRREPGKLRAGEGGILMAVQSGS